MAGRTRNRVHRGCEYALTWAHPAAELFPWLSDDEIDELAADIREHGQKHPVVRWRGEIVDGRNRELACLVAGVNPKYADLPGDTSEHRVLAGVISANVRRRHLSASQRAMIAADLANMRQGERTDREPSATLPKVSQADAAEQLNVSTRSVTAAAKVKDEAPELAPAVANGKLPVHVASAAAELPAEDREEIAGADDPAEVAKHKLNGTLPRPMHDASKPDNGRPSWWTGGNNTDPDHPYAELLKKFTALTRAITEAVNDPDDDRIRVALTHASKVKRKTHMIAYTSDVIAGDEFKGGTAKFIGLGPLRTLVRKAGKLKKAMNPEQVEKAFDEGNDPKGGADGD